MKICYLYDEKSDIELVLCEDSDLSYPLHNHCSVFTVGLLLKGSVRLTTGDMERLLGEDQTFVVYPYIPHCIESRETYTLLSFCINKNVIRCLNSDELKMTIRELINRTPELNAIDREPLRQLMSHIELLYDYVPVAVNPFVDEMKCRLEASPENRYSIDEMAGQAFTSKYHFIRSFKREIGLTPHQFQLQNRIRKAQRLLDQSDSMAEVALNTGFFDQSHFIRQFKKIVGLTPLTYKISSGKVGTDSND